MGEYADTNIRDFESFASSLRNYKRWCPALGKVAPTDIDAVLHASNRDTRDRYLVLEFKQHAGRLGIGQKILFDSWRKLGFDVVLVYENRDGLLYLSGDMQANGITLAEFGEMVKQWWYNAKESRGPAASGAA